MGDTRVLAAFKNVHGLVGAVEGIVASKSKEKWFKADLLDALGDLGFSKAQCHDIGKLMNEGRDQDLTQKMQQLIQANPDIQAQLTQTIGDLAAKRGVPATSVDPEALNAGPSVHSDYPESMPYYLARGAA